MKIYYENKKTTKYQFIIVCVCARACVQRAEQIGFQDSQAGLHLLEYSFHQVLMVSSMDHINEPCTDCSLYMGQVYHELINSNFLQVTQFPQQDGYDYSGSPEGLIEEPSKKKRNPSL